MKTPAKPAAGRGAMRVASPKAAPVAVAAKSAPVEPSKPRQGPIEWLSGAPRFMREVRAEGRKVTWTPWRETWITSVLVAIMIVITAAFFGVVDGALNFLMQLFLRFANGG